MTTRIFYSTISLLIILSFSRCARILPDNTTEMIQRRQRDLDGVYRAGKAVEGALQIGVTYQQFGELLQKLATEISIARERAQHDPSTMVAERPTIDGFELSLGVYKDSTQIWSDDIQFEHEGDFGLLHQLPESQSILRKYGLPAGDKSRIGMNYVRAVWQIAGERLAKANALFYGEGMR